jgi:large subunit ribosomal protein L25
MEVEIEIFQRSAKNEGETKRLRRDGKVPVVIYSLGKVGQSCFIKKDDIDAVLRNLETGYLPTTVFMLKDGTKKHKAIVKDIQYKVTNYEVNHIDFLQLVDDHKVDIKVPVECTGMQECVGVKAGGFLRQVMRHLPVRCLPKDIPSHFTIDIRDLEIHQAKRVKDLSLPPRVSPLVQPNDVVATVIK